MQKKMDKINKGKFETEKSIAITNKPSKMIRKFIKLSNLVPSDAQIDFDGWEFEINSENEILFIENEYLFFIAYWANRHKLDNYPKLLRYLSRIAKVKGLAWQDAFENFKKVREFMQIFVEITQAYQAVSEETEKLIKLSYGTKNQFLINTAESRSRERLFNVSYGSSSFRAFQAEKERPGLAKRLFDSAQGFLFLTVDENHKGNVSFGSFLDVIQDTDFRRLKRCMVCSNIFWAYRLNAKFCRKTCSNTHHQKLLRNNPIKNELVNARRSKTRFDKQVDEAKKVLRNAKTDTEKSEAQKCLQLAVSKRTNAAQKLNNLTQKLERSRKNGTL